MLVGRGAGGPTLPGMESLARGVEWRLMNRALNDGDNLVTPLGGFSRYLQPTQAIQTQMFRNTAGGVTVANRQRDGRKGIGWFSTAGSNSVFAFAPGGEFHYMDFGGLPAFPPLTAAIAGLPTPQFGWSTSIMAWCRKLLAGDGSSCRMTLGFNNNVVTSPSGPIPRCGLIGDGVGGYRYGSVNCPDGLGAGANGDSDRDANSLQPPDLVSPGAAWWHTRIKMIPATPTQPARWGAYHNGVLQTPVFTQLANLPRGHQGVSDTFCNIEATISNFSGDVAALHIPELVLHDVRVWLEDSVTL